MPVSIAAIKKIDLVLRHTYVRKPVTSDYVTGGHLGLHLGTTPGPSSTGRVLLVLLFWEGLG
jgi:hypothetical protein